MSEPLHDFWVSDGELVLSTTQNLGRIEDIDPGDLPESCQKAFEMELKEYRANEVAAVVEETAVRAYVGE